MGAYRDLSFDDGILTAWELAKSYAPDLPDTYQEAHARWEANHGPGSIVEIDGMTAMVLSHDGDEYYLIYPDGSTSLSPSEAVTFSGRSVRLSDIVSFYSKQNNAVSELAKNLRKNRGVTDSTTGRTYESIRDWCEDTGLSPATASRLLNGKRDEVQGHRLEYVSG